MKRKAFEFETGTGRDIDLKLFVAGDHIGFSIKS
jgi:hypothetical protein